LKGVVMVETLKVELGERSYPIMVGSKTLDYLGEAVRKLGCGSRLLVVTNDTVGPLYGERVKNSLQKAGFDLLYYELPDGEEFKSLQSAEKLYTIALEGGLERGSAVVALGGGVIGDLAGFVAATYMRGVPYIQVPTTLLAQVDSSVGGKVAVNHPLGKNMIGCFYQPRLTFTDVRVLHTLAAREVYAGLAEVIKYGVIRDPSFFCFLEEQIENILALDEDAVIEVIKRSCAIKAEIVEKDEREEGLRAILNFGHTVGHALEAITGYRVYRHGEAVAMGMVVAAAISVGRGLMQDDEQERLVKLLIKAGLPVVFPFTAEEIIPLLLRDKKASEGKPRFVLPLSLGKAELFSDVETEEVRVAIEKCSERKVAD
jgi:3-dehydroquinate synthase